MNVWYNAWDAKYYGTDMSLDALENKQTQNTTLLLWSEVNLTM